MIYQGITHSDNLIHNYINQILNLFTPTPNSGTVKLMTNTECKSKYGDTSEDYVNQLKRDIHGHANIRVQRCETTPRGYCWKTPEYYYVTSSIYFTDNGMYLSLARDFAEKIANNSFTNNKFLLIDNEEKFHIIEYNSVRDEFVQFHNDKDHCRNYNGNRNFLYKVVEPAIDMNNDEHPNSCFFTNVHIGVTRYATHIKGTPCKVRFFNNDGSEASTNVYKSTKELYDALTKAFAVTFSYKTFIRLVQKNSLENLMTHNGKEVLMCFCLAEEEPLSPVVTEKVSIEEFDAVVESMKALDIVVEESDIYLMKALDFSPEEFVQYLLKKERIADEQYNKEFAMPEESEEFYNFRQHKIPDEQFVNPFKETK